MMYEYIKLKTRILLVSATHRAETVGSQRYYKNCLGRGINIKTNIIRYY